MQLLLHMFLKLPRLAFDKVVHSVVKKIKSLFTVAVFQVPQQAKAPTGDLKR